MVWKQKERLYFIMMSSNTHIGKIKELTENWTIIYPNKGKHVEELYVIPTHAQKQKIKGNWKPIIAEKSKSYSLILIIIDQNKAMCVPWRST